MLQLPNFSELPTGSHGGPYAWHVFGQDDNVGLVNLLTPEVVRDAAGQVRTGKVFSLSAPLDLFTPAPFPARGVPRHTIRTKPRPASTILDDCLDNFFPQAYSQWDSLAHAALRPGEFYNGPASRTSSSDTATRSTTGPAGASSAGLAVEAMPFDQSVAAQPFGFLHQTLIGGFGMALGELWWLRELVADCHADGVYEAMLVSAPAHIRGGVGSPANAVAIK